MQKSGMAKDEGRYWKIRGIPMFDDKGQYKKPIYRKPFSSGCIYRGVNRNFKFRGERGGG